MDSISYEQDENNPEEIMEKIKPSSCGLKRTYSRLDISADKWLLVNDPISLAKLENPPSLADGLKRETEKDLRFFGCEFIQSGAILLKLPQTAAATGQILFQRFYYQKLEHLDLNANYVQLKNNVIKAERRILNTLGFVVHVHHPHKLIYIYLHSLKLLSSKELLQKAWSFMNDGLRTDIFLRYKPETIACACIYLAARTINDPISLPKTPFPWFELFDASDRDVKAISLILMELYNKTETPRLSRLVEQVDKLRKKSEAAIKENSKSENNGNNDSEI